VGIIELHPESLAIGAGSNQFLFQINNPALELCRSDTSHAPSWGRGEKLGSSLLPKP
jgi:hypothetical protein